VPEIQLPLPISALPPDLAPSELAPRQRVYVNRNLRLELVSLVGFDMDYTLAIYRQDAMDRLSIEATAAKLVELGYPESLTRLHCRTDFPIRGLLIDRKLGNVLKMDRYRYVKKAYHGLRELTREERQQTYHARPVRVGDGRYHWVDTLYAMSEVALFAAAIDELEALEVEVDPGKLFDDIRSSIDLAHRDGTIVDAIMREPERFLIRDPELGATFHKLRSSGKRLFLLTNSQPGYTDHIMSYLLDGSVNGYPSWRAYFDIIVTGAMKPRFFAENDVRFEPAEPGLASPEEGFERGRLYRGGCLHRFRELSGADGDRVLYVGDHIYGDVLRAKKESAWRTAMIIQEMDRELMVHESLRPKMARMDELEAVNDALHEELRMHLGTLRRLTRELEAARETGSPTRELSASRVRHRRLIERTKRRLRSLEAELETLEATVDRAFHPFWGSLFKAGPEVSLFGDQVEQYACLYTDRVSNLAHYSPGHYFRSPRDRMPHELD
jgi:HAD superfamily 5'-nucleotidase-like hydrolase